MDTIYNIGELEFHDSVITSILHEEDRVTLEIDYVSQGEALIDGILQIRKVEKVLRDDNELRIFTMETESGPQIIDLKLSRSELKMTLDWASFNPNHNYINIYVLFGKNISATFLISRRHEDEDMDAPS